MAREFLFAGNRICGVVAATTSREMARQLRDALRYTRTIEVRLDWLNSDRELQRFLIRLGGTKFARKTTLIATCRRRETGGRFTKGVATQLAVLRHAIAAGCRW
ncbi:MAG: type I 3-dehydroquinate dehydratase, partial [Candidatus Acidiferrales bacterium]